MMELQGRKRVHRFVYPNLGIGEGWSAKFLAEFHRESELVLSSTSSAPSG